MNKKVTAAEADALVRGNWFKNYTNEVLIIEGSTKLNNFYGEDRGVKNGGNEYIVFDGDLIVAGDIQVGNDHSIYVVLGNLEAESFETGDSVFIVAGKLKINKYFLKLMNEGIFMDGHTDWDDQDDENPGPRAISSPLIIWYLPNKRDYLLYRSGTQIAKSVEQMKDKIKDEFIREDDGEFFLEYKKLSECLRKGEIIFK